MTNLSIFDFESNNIRFEKRDNCIWVNLTDMAKASGKRIDNWKANSSTIKFLTTLEHSLESQVILNNIGGTTETTGTWGIEEVAIEFAGWCSIAFKIWMLTQIKTLLREGTVSLPQQPKLPSRVVALETAKAVAEIQDLIAYNNPRLAQFLIDHAVSDIMTNQNTLTEQKLKGVVEIAEEMGFKVNFNNRSQLGKFVKKICGELAQQEERLVNGTMRMVACYPSESEEVKKAVLNFFEK